MSTSKNPPQNRDYKKEARTKKHPTQIKHREERKLLRAQKTRKVGHPLAGDVAHIVPLAGGGKNNLTNARVESIRKKLAGWRKRPNREINRRGKRHDGKDHKELLREARQGCCQDREEYKESLGETRNPSSRPSAPSRGARPGDKK